VKDKGIEPGQRRAEEIPVPAGLKKGGSSELSADQLDQFSARNPGTLWSSWILFVARVRERLLVRAAYQQIHGPNDVALPFQVSSDLT